MLLLYTVFVCKVIYRFNHELVKNLYCKSNFKSIDLNALNVETAQLIEETETK